MVKRLARKWHLVTGCGWLTATEGNGDFVYLCDNEWRMRCGVHYRGAVWVGIN